MSLWTAIFYTPIRYINIKMGNVMSIADTFGGDGTLVDVIPRQRTKVEPFLRAVLHFAREHNSFGGLRDDCGLFGPSNSVWLLDEEKELLSDHTWNQIVSGTANIGIGFKSAMRGNLCADEVVLQYGREKMDIEPISARDVILSAALGDDLDDEID